MEQKQHDKDIDTLAAAIIEKIQTIKSYISDIGKNVKLSYFEKILRTNIVSHFTSLLQNITTKLNTTQKEHLSSVQQTKVKTNNKYFDKDEDDASFLHEEVNSPVIRLDQAHLNKLNANKDIMIQRDQEIAKITEQMKEISQIFQDLAEMVVEQGTMLDRIDENIVSASVNIDEGNKQLNIASESASDYRRRLLTILGIIFVAVIVIIVIIGATRK